MLLPSPSLPHRAAAAALRLPLRWRLGSETLLLLTALYLALFENRRFFAAALAGRPFDNAADWGYAVALGLGLTALHVLLLAPLATRRTARPAFAAVLAASALASFYIEHYGIYLDPAMLRNLLHTNLHEARELLGPALWLHLALHAGLPILVLWRIEIEPRRWPRAIAQRLAVVGAAALILAGTVLAAFQPLASLVRNQREVRYLVTPANLAWSLAQAAGTEARGRTKARAAIGLDAVAGPSWAARAKPRLVVLVVGETARAANWGLSGYARQTTPELARLPVINFSQVSSCGTDTETSLPCMFAPVGRRQYDERRIRGSESLLHVVARAGVGVTWRDNQSGCKGVCEGLPQQSVLEIEPQGLCEQGHCLDEGLLHDLPQMLQQAQGTQLLVLHPLGNHGPSYFKRYPAGFARYANACASDDLRRCSREQIIDAYDNALLYTDHWLARLVRTLQQHADRVDSAFVFVSDHGESLGEHNLFLHGMPYAIAPDVQTRVPMVMWLSDGFARSTAIDPACLARRATRPAAHDHLFHTLLAMLDVRTSLYDPAWDLTAGCTGAP